MSDRGLREIVAAQTRLSDIDGQAGRLWYVGYDINDLAGRTSYEEVVHLLESGERRQELRRCRDDVLVRRAGVLSGEECRAPETGEHVATVRLRPHDRVLRREFDVVPPAT